MTISDEEMDRLESPERRGDSVLSRPMVAAPLFLAVVIVGIVLVSSFDSVPVPITVPEPEEEELTDFERRRAALDVLEALELDAIVAYPSVLGVTMVDLANGRVLPTEEVEDLPDGGNYFLLPGARQSWVLDLDDLGTFAVSEISGRLSSTDQDGRYIAEVFGGVRGGDPETDERIVYALDGPFGVDAGTIRLIAAAGIDRDARTIVVPGLGTLVEDEDGTTFLYGADGYADYSDHLVLAATPDVRIERRCREVCDPFLVTSGGERPLPDVFNQDIGFSISPDGQWILIHQLEKPHGPTLPAEGVGAQLFEVASGRLMAVAAPAPGPPSWAEDSSYVSWLEPASNAAELFIVFVEDRSVAAIDLDGLDAPNRDGTALRFFPATAPS